MNAFSGLSESQVSQVKQRGQELLRWVQQHRFLHYMLGVGSIVFFLVSDFFILLKLPSLFLPSGSSHQWYSLLAAILVVGLLRGWLVYAILGFSIHEASTHDLAFPGNGRLDRGLNWIACNLSRLFCTDPNYYREVHLSHHSNFGTEKDAQFLNFIFPKRYWVSLMPFAMFFNYNDFFTHRSLGITKSYVFSLFLSLVYNGVYIYFTIADFGAIFSLAVIVVIGPHVTFNLDRLRQFSEHNLMPIENKDGARSFGPGFWGLFVGGGPWGSPCHWEHHLIPELPWYQTIVLHRSIKQILTARQKRQYLLTPLIGYPRLLRRLWTEPPDFAAKVAASGVQFEDKIFNDIPTSALHVKDSA